MGFIVIASMALVVLFFFDLHVIVVFMYAVSAASTSAAVVWRPLLKKCSRLDIRWIYLE